MSKIVFKTASASDDGLTFNNPDRGFRSEINLRIEKTRKEGINYDWRTVFADSSEEEQRAVIDRIFDIYVLQDKGYVSKLTNAYLYITCCHDEKHIPDKVKNALRLYFKVCRERKIKNNVRFAYNWSYARNYKVSDENKELLITECASEEVILSHIEELAPIIAEYKDTIHKISSGFIGYGGEMAAPLQYPCVSYAEVIKAVMEKFCLPNGLYYSCRLPQYKKEFTDAYPDFIFADRIGINNDAMFGEQTKQYWESAWYQKGNPGKLPIDWWEQVAAEAHSASPDGEMYTTRGLLDTSCGRYYNPRIPSGLEIILECFRHRHTQMSQWHSFHESLEKNRVIDKWIRDGYVTAELLDAEGIVYDENRYPELLAAVKGRASQKTESKYPEDFSCTEVLEHIVYLESINRENVIERWINSEKITPEILKENKITFDPDWFLDDEGKMVERNPYEFLRDHLGYRIKLISADVEVNETVNVNLELQNFGFASAFNLQSGFALLDKSGRVISEIFAGEPSRWHSHDPKDPYSDEILTHRVSASLSLPEQGGEYILAFFMRNSMGEYVKTANKCESLNGHQIIANI